MSGLQVPKNGAKSTKFSEESVSSSKHITTISAGGTTYCYLVGVECDTNDQPLFCVNRYKIEAPFTHIRIFLKNLFIRFHLPST